MRFIALIVLVSGCAKDVVHPDELGDDDGDDSSGPDADTGCGRGR